MSLLFIFLQILLLEHKIEDGLAMQIIESLRTTIQVWMAFHLKKYSHLLQIAVMLIGSHTALKTLQWVTELVPKD